MSPFLLLGGAILLAELAVAVGLLIAGRRPILAALLAALAVAQAAVPAALAVIVIYSPMPTGEAGEGYQFVVMGQLIACLLAGGVLGVVTLLLAVGLMMDWELDRGRAQRW